MKVYGKAHSHTEEPISHLSIPIEDNDLERTRAAMEAHGASMRKIRSPDNWWTIFFPDGTIKISDPSYGERVRHKVLFPDGFWFLFDEAIIRRDKTYKQMPILHIDLSGEDERDTEETTRSDNPVIH